ncbi:MAG TPA: P-loop NTPase fold protein [Salinimicrobium sp.]|nr:P-loop NTPase fold protein [Salinimicrobium sp.]
MKTTPTHLLENIFNSKLFKVPIVLTIGIIVLFILKSTINEWIISYGVFQEGTLHQIPDFITIVLFILLLLYIYYKLFLKEYQLSVFQQNLLFICSSIYIVFRFLPFSNGWSFISLDDIQVLYIDLVGFTMLVSVTVIIIGKKFKKWFQKEKSASVNPFVSDDPVLSVGDDKLQYEERAKQLIGYIKQLNFKHSFSIGIVGPWGNGKSSLITLMEKQLDSIGLENTIYFKFLPCLNHNDKEIISEFFNQLSLELEKYSGKLSNQLLNYSDKLIKFYNNKNLSDFLKPRSSSFSSGSSLEMYSNINDTLKELNKKCIVFIDDLDRLSNIEVLEVLKLVRNTANFKNFIFIIALDKDYVLNSLTKSEAIADHAFVDKFFQLEVYLPEINALQLKEEFLKWLKIKLPSNPNFIEEVEGAIYRTDNLFNDYISNFRGVKRLVNQIVFDYHSLPDALNTNDFLNFTYLKMTFPSAVKFLNINRDYVIPYDPESKLRELVPVVNNEQAGDTDNLLKAIREGYNYTGFRPEYKKYDIFQNLVNSEEFNMKNNLSEQQNFLLAKTLIALFGKQNETEKHTSIKFADNLRKLLQQKILANDLSSWEFENIFDPTDDYQFLKNKLDEGQINNILDRLDYYSTTESNEAQHVIMVLLIIFSRAEEYKMFEASVWKVIMDFVIRYNKKRDPKSHTQIWNYIKSDFLLSNNYQEEKKIKIIAKISENRIRLSFDEWGTDEEDLKKTSFELFKNLVEKKQNTLWDVKDYSFYHAYHHVCLFNDVENINPYFIEYWKQNDVTLLCAQMVENEPWTTKMVRTSDFVVKAFGSKKDYKDFIIGRTSTSKTSKIAEYLKLLELESYTDFSTFVRFEFKHFDWVKQKLQYVIESNNLKNDEYVNIVEIVLKTTEREIWEITKTDVYVISGYTKVKSFSVEGAYYTFLQVKSNVVHQAQLELFKHYKKILDDQKIESTFFPQKGYLEIRDPSNKIEVISIQPDSYEPQLYEIY